MWAHSKIMIFMLLYSQNSYENSFCKHLLRVYKENVYLYVRKFAFEYQQVKYIENLFYTN